MKISKEELLAFDQDIVSILSERRLKGYEGNIKQHYENIDLILNTGKRIVHLELYLRNKLDYCLKKLEGEEWIKSPKSLALIKQKSPKPLSEFDPSQILSLIAELDPSQILSRLTLGKIVRLIRGHRVENYMFDLSKMDFKKYHWSNSNFCRINGKRHHLSHLSKVVIVLHLILSIRNRAFHWENLLKTTLKENGEFPRITHKENGSTIGVMPNMILEFLDDLIDLIGNDVIEKYRDKKS